MSIDTSERRVPPGSTLDGLRRELAASDLFLARGPRDVERFARQAAAATPDEPLTIFAVSCPDYSHDGARYTCESLGEGVPMLSRVHLGAGSRLLSSLDAHGVPFVYNLLIADVEAGDDDLCERFTQGDRAEFLRRCGASVDATASMITGLDLPRRIRARMRASTVYETFGRTSLDEAQRAYGALLAARHEADSSFRARVVNDTASRMDLYRRVYRDRFSLPGGPSAADSRFLVGRTMRTMAQYLSIARLILRSCARPAVVNHDSRNAGLFGSLGKFPTEPPAPSGQLPVLVVDFRI